MAYKIKDIEILTGIKAHTIRIWEKRYGILEPERTDTQIRTYSDKELAYLLNISLLNKSGYKISKIADMSESEVSEKVWELKYKATDFDDEKLVLALVEMDEYLFHDALSSIIQNKGLKLAFSQHIIPFLERIGVMWVVGTINPAQEHFMSNLIRQKVISELDRLPIPDLSTSPIILYLPEHEWHELGLLFYQYILRSNGIHSIYLGQSLPYQSLKESLEKTKAKTVITSWLTAVDERFIVTYFDQLQRDFPELEIYAGGAQVNNFSDKLPKTIHEIRHYEDLLGYFTQRN